MKSSRFLGFDLGAESGRAMLGELRGRTLKLLEVGRFPNTPIRLDGSLRWDIQSLWHEMTRALAGLEPSRLDSIGVDTWGCDYALIDQHGNLVEHPFHYRDSRTDGVMEQVWQRVSRERIYSTTGIQFLPFNTLYQIAAACRNTPAIVRSADALVMIPDLVNRWLTGRLCSEVTIATTTQFVDARTRTWASGLLEELDVPTRLLPPLVEPGTRIGSLLREVCPSLEGTPVVAPACHDTGSAMAAVPIGPGRAFLSSGTWSLLGTELPAPVITSKASALNFSNEGGVGGTTRLLKNIGGLWLLQSCRRCWADAGRDYPYEDLVAAAADDRYSFRSLFDPDDPLFLHPDDMVSSIAAYCRDTGQPEPKDPPGYSRSILESLAFKYRVVLDSLEEVTGLRFGEIRVGGGGSRNRLLNQFTADATGRTILAGPVEATALGNIAMQMVATGAVSSIADARAIVEDSFPPERFEPVAVDRWEPHYRRFQQYVSLSCA